MDLIKLIWYLCILIIDDFIDSLRRTLSFFINLVKLGPSEFWNVCPFIWGLPSHLRRPHPTLISPSCSGEHPSSSFSFSLVALHFLWSQLPREPIHFLTMKVALTKPFAAATRKCAGYMFLCYFLLGGPAGSLARFAWIVYSRCNCARHLRLHTTLSLSSLMIMMLLLPFSLWASSSSRWSLQ